MSALHPSPGATADVARRHAADLISVGRERPIEVDQTNVSVVVDEAVIVKWLDPPVHSPHPAIAVLEHLRAVGFDAVPACLGVEIVNGWVVALVSRYVPGARDGWEWFVDDVESWIDDPSSDVATASAAALGALTAQLHVALATPSAVLPEPVGPVGVTDEWDRGRALLAEARQVADGWPAEVLAGRDEQIAAILDAAPRGTVAGLRIHGDLHVGQFLRAGGRLFVIDFEGNPLLGHEHHDLLRPPVVDLASLVQSVDHACRVVERRRHRVSGAVDEFAAQLCDAVMASYRQTLEGLGHAHLFDAELVRPLCVVQELHELVYASRHLPHWAEVTARTLQALITEGTPT